MNGSTRTRIGTLMALALCPVAIGCGEGGSDVADATGEWVHEASTEGNVTTVRTLRGSVWGGSARLTEEASIGVDQGSDEYMLGQVRGLAASDEAIYVLDSQLPAVRVYDLAGRHLVDLGREGQGPGEFTRPEDLAIGPDGKLYVEERGRIVVLTPAGRPAGTMPMRSNFTSSRPMTVTDDGEVYVPDLVVHGVDLEEWRHGMRRVTRDGFTEEIVEPPDFDFEEAQLVYRTENGVSARNVPYYPSVEWVLGPSGAMIAGVSDEYRIDVHRPDGVVVRIEKSWDPLPVHAEERAWTRARITFVERRRRPDWRWNGPGIPEVKPAFSTILPGHDGRIWVRRIVDTRRVDDCDEDPTRVDEDRYPRPCWEDVHAIDVFEGDGSYLGPVEIPEGARLTFPRAFIRDDMIVAYHEDQLGVPRVKRYRLTFPED